MSIMTQRPIEVQLQAHDVTDKDWIRSSLVEHEKAFSLTSAGSLLGGDGSSWMESFWCVSPLRPHLHADSRPEKEENKFFFLDHNSCIYRQSIVQSFTFTHSLILPSTRTHLEIVNGHVHVVVVFLFGSIVGLRHDQHVRHFSVFVDFARHNRHRLQ